MFGRADVTPLYPTTTNVQVFLTLDYLAIAMEYAAGGDMFQLVVRQRGLVEQDARWYFQQLIIAIDYCHKMVNHSLPVHFSSYTAPFPIKFAKLLLVVLLKPVWSTTTYSVAFAFGKSVYALCVVLLDMGLLPYKCKLCATVCH